LEFRDISRVSEAITANRMNPYCQRRNCSPMHFPAMIYIGYVDIAGRSPAKGHQTSAGWGKCVNITRQMALWLLHSTIAYASFFVFQ